MIGPPTLPNHSTRSAVEAAAPSPSHAPVKYIPRLAAVETTFSCVTVRKSLDASWGA